MDTQQTIELVMWETVRRDCKYPKEDNNDGFIYGINLIDIDGEGDIIDVQWFKTNEKRNKFIDKNNLRIVDEY